MATSYLHQFLNLNIQMFLFFRFCSLYNAHNEVQERRHTLYLSFSIVKIHLKIVGFKSSSPYFPHILKLIFLNKHHKRTQNTQVASVGQTERNIPSFVHQRTVHILLLCQLYCTITLATYTLETENLVSRYCVWFIAESPVSTTWDSCRLFNVSQEMKNRQS